MAAVSAVVKLVVVGLIAGILSGLFGIGGGIVLVPLLVYVASFDQHRAHATSLAAGMFFAAAGAALYSFSGDVDIEAGVFLAVGALAGAPVGAHLMHRTPEGRLKVAFGVLLVVLSVTLVLL